MIYTKTNRPGQCTCPAPDLDAFVAKAVQQANRSLLLQRGALTTIRNGGWEHAFRNRILEVTEEFPNFIGFTEACVEGVNRIDLAYRCGGCGRCVLVAEMKSNFTTQPRDIGDRHLDACLQLERLAGIGLPAYLVYVVIEQTWYGKQSNLVTTHNRSLSRSCSYKKFIEEGAEGLSPAHTLAEDPAVSTEERCFAAHRVRVSARAWLARGMLGKRTGNVLLTFINAKGKSSAQRNVTAKVLAARRRRRKRGKAKSGRGKLAAPRR